MRNALHKFGKLWWKDNELTEINWLKLTMYVLLSTQYTCHLTGCGKNEKLCGNFGQYYAEESANYAEKTTDYAEIKEHLNKEFKK